MEETDWRISSVGEPLGEDPEAHARAAGLEITFKAHFYKLQTLADGGIRLSFDLSLNELEAVTKLPTLAGQQLQLGIVPVPTQEARRGPF